MFIKTIVFALFLICLTMATAQAELCKVWEKVKVVGEMEHTIINEASGLATSEFADRLYHINDSGDGPFFYQTDLNGQKTKKIAIENFEPADVEDLAYGKCGQIEQEKNCLYIGDIGDNAEARTTISVVVIEEVEEFPEKVTPLKTLVLKYPDKAHNAEGMAIHPNGDLYILTKEVDYANQRAVSAILFKLTKEKMNGSSENPLELEKVFEYEFPFILFNFNLWGRIVTAFDISADGKRLLILTYKTAIEINIDLEVGPLKPIRQMVPGIDHQIIAIPALAQQEAVAFTRDGTAFYYNTEFKENKVELIKVSCKSTQ